MEGVICDKYIIGPKEGIVFSDLTLGEVLYEKLKNAKKGKLLGTNANTGACITYEEFYKQSVKLASSLKRFGLGKGDVVAVISENQVNYWVPVTAAIYLGAIVNPLNPSYTQGELKRSLDQSKPKIIFCSENSKEMILHLYEQLIYVERVIIFGETIPFTDIKTSMQCFNGIDVDVESFKPTKVSMDDAVLILCSSGTTGFPKGVMLTHRSPRHYLACLTDPKYSTASEDDVCLIVPPFFHLIGCMQQLLSIYCQGFSVILNKFKPDIFLRSIQEYKVTRMLLVPTLMIFLSNSPLVDKYDMSSIAEISWGGASMSKVIEAAVKKRLNLDLIRQAYGTTELGSVATLQVDINKSGSCGCLAHDFIGKICNPETNEILGPMKVGEIRLKGPSVMKGYIRNPEATIDSFDEDGFLKTGDAGYYDEDGYFYIVDRFKELIKYKAFQVPPAEIEAILLTHPAVLEAAVVPKPDVIAGEVPIAFVVKQDGSDVTEQELIDLVAEHLSIQKRLYGGVVFVDGLPKTKSGKVIRRDLKEAAKSY